MKTKAAPVSGSGFGLVTVRVPTELPFTAIDEGDVAKVMVGGPGV